MDQQIGNELPPLNVPEQAASSSFEAQMPSQMHEAQSSRAIEQGVAHSAMALPTIQSASPVPATAAMMPAAQGLPAATGLPQIADDTDLIEKEWVIKAKEIIARTRQDPHRQNKEVEQMKADYMKKRYNKDIKLTED